MVARISDCGLRIADSAIRNGLRAKPALGRLGECAVQGVQEEKLTKPLSCMPLIDGEASQKRDRNIWIGRKFPGDVLWQIREINGER